MRWNLRMDVEAIMARVSGEHGGRVADDRDDLLRRRAHTGASNLQRQVSKSVHFVFRLGLTLAYFYERLRNPEVIYTRHLIRLLPPDAALSRGPRACTVSDTFRPLNSRPSPPERIHKQPIDKVDDPDDDNGDGQRADKDGAARSDALARRRAPPQAAQL